ncbi:MAG TPA: hypothetical protein VFP10_13640, partial [Candidatus Eisenbacteria bacterium]|nr:hypothetical protein [Candidatus Eisenbacteria bacterium]
MRAGTGENRRLPRSRFGGFWRSTMLVVMKKDATPEQIQHVVDTIQRMGLVAHPIPGAQRTAIGITGNRGSLD